MAGRSIEGLYDFLAEEFPQTRHLDLKIEQAGGGTARVRLPISEEHLRPGGTVSGPTMFWLADLAFYMVLMSDMDGVEQAVTTNLNINFLRRPGTGDMIAEVKMLKDGKRLCVAECTILSEGEPGPVAHVTATYSIPPAKS